MFNRKIILSLFLGLVVNSAFSEPMPLEQSGKLINYQEGNLDLDAIHSNIQLMMERAGKVVKKDNLIKIQGKSFSKQGAIQHFEDLGFDFGPEDDLYFFITWSMPKKMIAQYLEDAVSVGATVIVSGVPPEIKTLDEYIVKYIQPIIRDDGLNPQVDINPMLFDSFDIDVVPAVVYSKNVKNICKKESDIDVDYKGTTLNITKCNKEKEDTFIKMTGATTVKYALEAFLDNGFDTQKYIDRQLEFYQTGGQNVKKILDSQMQEMGEYKDGVLTPYEFEGGIFKDL